MALGKFGAALSAAEIHRLVADDLTKVETFINEECVGSVEQIAEIRQTAAEAGTHLVVNERLDLEGGGQRAYLLVFRDNSQRRVLDEKS